MANNRLDRELETREETKRKRSWVRPGVLPRPKDEHGYKYRWIRVSSRNEFDPTNISSKLQEGWEPVKASEHPEIFVTGLEDSRFKDNIIMGGLMLCKAPIEMVEERNAFYRQQAEAQTNSVDNNFMKENDPRMPLFNERKSSVTFGKN